jgi:hypothetical protein
MLIRLGCGMSAIPLMIMAMFRPLTTENGSSSLTAEDGRLLCRE